MALRRDDQIARFLSTLAKAIEEGDVSASDVWQVLTEPRPTGYTIEGPLEAAAGGDRVATLLDLHRRIEGPLNRPWI